MERQPVSTVSPLPDDLQDTPPQRAGGKGLVGRLLDQFRRPVKDVAQLATEVSAVGSVYNRPPMIPDLFPDMSPERLGMIMRGADQGETLEWQLVASKLEMNYSHYRAVLAKRRRRIRAQPITIMPASDEGAYPAHAELVQDWLETEVLQEALYDITDAIGRGFSVSEIIWDSKPGRVVPSTIMFREARFFEIDVLDGETVLLRTELGYQPLQPHKFIVHKHKDISGQLIRSGLHRAVAFLWMFSHYTLRDWALFTQGYGLPIRLGKYGPEASDNDKKVLKRAVFSIAGDIAAIVPKSMDVEFVDQPDKKAGTELYEKRLDWLNREVSKLVLGGTAGTEAINGGHAVGREHRAGEDDVCEHDCQLIQTTLTRQLVQTMVAFSFGPQDKYPTVQIGQPQQVDLAAVIDGVTDLAGLGLTVKASEIRDRLGLSKPEDGDEVIGGKQDTPPPNPLIPHPAVKVPMAPAMQSMRGLLDIITMQHQVPPDVIEQMTQRLAADAAGALAGMTDQVRHVIETATDMRDLAHRMHSLKLPADAFAEAMARGMALAELAGEASLLAELASRPKS